MVNSGIDLFSIQEEILEYVQEEINWFVTSGGVADAVRIADTNGVRDPFVVLRFGDDMPSSGGANFAGSRYDEYYSYVDALCCADNDRTARQLSNMVKNLLLGKSFTNSGALSKIFGGGTFASAADNSVPEFYISIASFRFGSNMIADGTGYDPNDT